MRVQALAAASPRREPDSFDDRIVWFQHEHRAIFITDLVGGVLHANAAAHGLLEAGQLSLDAQHRLRIARRSTRGVRVDAIAPPPVGTTTRSLIVLSPSLWLAIMVQRHRDRMIITVAPVGLQNEFDIGSVARDLGISESEAPVLRGLAHAVCPKEISRELNLSIHTIRSHLRSIYAKLGVRTSAEAQFRILQALFIVQ